MPFEVALRIVEVPFVVEEGQPLSHLYIQLRCLSVASADKAVAERLLKEFDRFLKTIEPRQWGGKMPMQAESPVIRPTPTPPLFTTTIKSTHPIEAADEQLLSVRAGEVTQGGMYHGLRRGKDEGIDLEFASLPAADFGRFWAWCGLLRQIVRGRLDPNVRR